MSSNRMPAADDIISLIQYLGQTKQTLKLTKSFREMVLHQQVNILEVGSDCATFKVTDASMCAVLEGHVFLHNLLFSKPVSARVKHMDFRQGIFILTGFTYAETEWRERQYERVQPKSPIYVNLRWRGKTLRAAMDNISVNGMGLLVYKLNEKWTGLVSGINVQLDFQLPPGQLFTAIKGTTVYLNAISGSLVKVGIQLFPKSREARAIEKYVAQRKREILHELDGAYRELCKPRGVESLYF